LITEDLLQQVHNARKRLAEYVESVESAQREGTA
jgi:hypothetical protein